METCNSHAHKDAEKMSVSSLPSLPPPEFTPEQQLVTVLDSDALAAREKAYSSWVN